MKYEENQWIDILCNEFIIFIVALNEKSADKTIIS